MNSKKKEKKKTFSQENLMLRNETLTQFNEYYYSPPFSLSLSVAVLPVDQQRQQQHGNAVMGL